MSDSKIDAIKGSNTPDFLKFQDLKEQYFNRTPEVTLSYKKHRMFSTYSKFKKNHQHTKDYTLENL